MGSSTKNKKHSRLQVALNAGEFRECQFMLNWGATFHLLFTE